MHPLLNNEGSSAGNGFMDPSDASDFDLEGEVLRELSASVQTVKESLAEFVTYERHFSPCGLCHKDLHAGNLLVRFAGPRVAHWVCRCVG